MRTVSEDHKYTDHAEPIDLDQDGDMDVLIGGCANGTYENTITWARNNGSQNFTIISIGTLSSSV